MTEQRIDFGDDILSDFEEEIVDLNGANTSGRSAFQKNGIRFSDANSDILEAIQYSYNTRNDIMELGSDKSDSLANTSLVSGAKSAVLTGSHHLTDLAAASSFSQQQEQLEAQANDDINGIHTDTSYELQPRYENTIKKYAYSPDKDNQDIGEDQIEKLILENTSKSKYKNRASAKTIQVWDQLEDIKKVRRQELERTIVSNSDSSGMNGLVGTLTTMTAVAPIQDQPVRRQGESLDDLVPAGLVKPGETMAIIEPKYTPLGETLRRNTPNEMQCSMFCGGKRCKYESGDQWGPNDMALDGIYSHWITDDLLAMARPNTAQIEQKKIIQQFQLLGIKTIINLQMPGEHSSCGPKLEPSGFTYDPNDFMKQKIFFYNFVWMKDFGEASMTNLLDMVKVLSFSLTEGKVAVHCHAGLGRTGVLIACYLVYFLRVRSNDAIRYVRLKRPNAVQTRGQIACVKEFETFILPQCLVFSSKPIGDRDKKLGRFNLETCLKRQKFIVHGFEARGLKQIPKILYVIFERIIKLFDRRNLGYDVNVCNFTHHFVVWRIHNSDPASTSSTASGLSSTRRSSRSLDTESGTSTVTTTPGDTRPCSETNSLVHSCSSALSGVDDKRLDEILGDGLRDQSLEDNRVTLTLANHIHMQRAAQQEKLPSKTIEEVFKEIMDQHKVTKNSGSENILINFHAKIKQYQQDLNFKMSAWDRLKTETDVTVLITLVYEWLEHLRTPILDTDSITYIVILADNMEKAIRRLKPAQAYVLEYTIRFVARFQPLKKEKAENMMRRLLASLTQQSIPIEGKLHPVGKSFPKLRGGTLNSCLNFMMLIYERIVEEEGLRVEQSSTA